MASRQLRKLKKTLGKDAQSCEKLHVFIHLVVGHYVELRNRGVDPLQEEKIITGDSFKLKYGLTGTSSGTGAQMVTEFQPVRETSPFAAQGLTRVKRAYRYDLDTSTNKRIYLRSTRYA